MSEFMSDREYMGDREFMGDRECTCRPSDPCWFHSEHAQETIKKVASASSHAIEDVHQKMNETLWNPKEVEEEQLTDQLQEDIRPPGVLVDFGDKGINKFLQECATTCYSKGQDYRQGDPDLLSSFRKTGEELDLSMEKVWSVYAGKHWKALQNYIRTGGQSESEPIEGRIKDLVVYLLLFTKMVEERKSRDALTPDELNFINGSGKPKFLEEE